MPEAAPAIVILGGGQAGAAAAAFLRQFGWPGEVTLVGAEPLAPYHRPPLSKAWLKGEATAESLALRGPGFWETQRITLRLGTRAVALDRAARRIGLGDGSTLAYDHLILATGAGPSRPSLPGADHPGVLVLRDAADAAVLAARLGAGRHLAVVGGGWIGLEVAASARALGTAVTVLEREARALARVASPVLAEALAARHRAEGVALRLGCTVAGLAPDGVTLADGTRIPADAVLLATGARPDDALAAEAGLADPAGGVRVDARGRTADPRIHAIGDVTRRPLPGGGLGRLESVPSAIEQARAAAADLCGRPAPAPEIPWFWSDQYDLRVQIAGLLPPGARCVARGAPGPAGGFALFHLDGAGRVGCVEAVSDAAGFLAGRRLIAAARPVDAAALADPATPLARLAA